MFGARAAEHAVRYARGASEGQEATLRRQAEEEAARVEGLRGRQQGSEKLAQVRREMQAAMEEGCGVYREQGPMRAAVQTLAQVKSRFADVALEDTSKVFNTELVAALELENMLDVAETVAVAAAERRESRGAHACSDFAERDDQQFLHHSLVYHDGGTPRFDKKDVTLGRWEPEERKY